MKYIYLLIGIFSFGFANGQHLHHRPKAFTDSTGRYYQQASMPVYIFISASKDSMPALLKTISPIRTMSMKYMPMANLR